MLTSECANCPFWRNTETESGCAFTRPIDECEAFNKTYNTAKKYYSLEMFSKSGRDILRGFLKSRGIYYELSMAFGAYHFEILADQSEVKLINSVLDSKIICHQDMFESEV